MPQRAATYEDPKGQGVPGLYVEHLEQQTLSIPNPSCVWVTTLGLMAEEVLAGAQQRQVLAGAQHQPLHHGGAASQPWAFVK